VAYVGAGFSMPCGMPAWFGLLKGLLDVARDAKCSGPVAESYGALETCERALDNSQLAMAASILRKLLSPADLDEAIRQRFGNHVLAQAGKLDRDTMEARMKHLVRGPWVGILTTNYDTLIEKALGRWVDREVVMVNEDNPRLGSVLASAPSAGLFFVKAHGSISGGRLVLSTEEYDRTYLGTSRMTSFLSALFLRYYVVFVGCSLEDEVIRIRRKLSLDFDGLIPVAYALLPDSEQNRTRLSWLREVAKIEPILYPESDRQHTSVEKFLAEASRCVDLATREKTKEEVTRTNLARVPVRDRLDRIGLVNVDLLQLIAGQPNVSLDHLDLVDMTRIIGAPMKSRLYEISPEERVYRALFLVSVRLLTEVQRKGTPVRYVLPEDVRKQLSSIKQV